MHYHRAGARLFGVILLKPLNPAIFREYLPRKIALIKMDCGPIIFAHIAYSDAKTGDRLTIMSKRDLSGEGVFIALTDLIEANVQLDQLNKLLLQD
jgi:hypothetical protein